MSSVHYKFRATLEYKTLTFDGLHIGVDELKKAICDKENIRTESFDLLLTNAHTKREYTPGELVPRNSSVVVQRVPRENALKLPKVQDTSTSGIVTRNLTGSGSFHAQNNYINPEAFAGMSEEERIAHIKRVSTEKYSAANYQRRGVGIMSGPPPATYACNRCGQSGHWWKMCPLLNVRRTTGIPMEELMETHEGDPLAMLHPSGKLVKPIMHHQARLMRKHEPFPGHADESSGRSPSQPVAPLEVPEQYRCCLCEGLLRDAVLAACCGHSFCAECYQQQLLAHPTEPCPGPDCGQQISADSLIPNKTLRAAVQKYANELLTGVVPSTGGTTAIGGGLNEVGGANKPNVLTDTHSLLHKLLPNLAQAQAKRELATTGRSPLLDSSGMANAPTTTVGATPSAASALPKETTTTTPAEQKQQQPVEQRVTTATASPTAFDALSHLAPASAITTTPVSSGGHLQQSQAQSSAAFPASVIPLFDPNKPPPPLIPGLLPQQQQQQSSTFASLASSVTTSANATPTAAPHQQQPQQTPVSLSAEEMSSAWQSFLDRKEQAKAAQRASLFSAATLKRRDSESERDVDAAAAVGDEHRRSGGGISRRHQRSSRDEEQQDGVGETKSSTPLSAQELSSAWEVFLRRKDERAAQQAEKTQSPSHAEEKAQSPVQSHRSRRESSRERHHRGGAPEARHHQRHREQGGRHSGGHTRYHHNSSGGGSHRRSGEKRRDETKRRTSGGSRRRDISPQSPDDGEKAKPAEKRKEREAGSEEVRENQETVEEKLLHKDEEGNEVTTMTTTNAIGEEAPRPEKNEEMAANEEDHSKEEGKGSLADEDGKREEKTEKRAKSKESSRRKDEKKERKRTKEEKRAKREEEEEQHKKTKKNEEERPGKRERSKTPPPAEDTSTRSSAVNQLDLLFTQQRAVAQAQRFRHAPPLPPSAASSTTAVRMPDFRDESRWRPLAELQEDNSEPSGGAVGKETQRHNNNELFIDKAGGSVRRSTTSSEGGARIRVVEQPAGPVKKTETMQTEEEDEEKADMMIASRMAIRVVSAATAEAGPTVESSMPPKAHREERKRKKEKKEKRAKRDKKRQHKHHHRKHSSDKNSDEGEKGQDNERQKRKRKRHSPSSAEEAAQSSGSEGGGKRRRERRKNGGGTAESADEEGEGRKAGKSSHRRSSGGMEEKNGDRKKRDKQRR